MSTLLEGSRITALYHYPEHSIAWPLLSAHEYPWEALDGIKAYILSLGATLSEEEYTRIGEDVWVAKTARVAASASLNGPCIICADAEIRQGAFIRGSAIVGAGAVVGNSTELKNCILFDGVQVPHFNYVGDSILGYRSHMGAGAITSNVKSDKSLVKIRYGEECLETGRKKVGAMLGDLVEVGCNSVLNPGTVIGRETNVYPLSSVRGYVPASCIYKTAECVVKKH
ncbi:MAG: UDP-N-acetylglucosamine pyrophosphorylase [Clostridia bacterium]|nr:UDP-N-acetylglucosamine pyrophosphorylase [Clostridia bacterium]MBQ2249282.1 UDP-N-acetylglucosamine pyrophosphorylase [Clostridia bacterium]MBQ5612192.1 UDP-N-acetylglucosamine pyrophosphorylase [Clostridia bacterium]